MEAKLAEYRAKKAKEKRAEERREQFWKIVTFQGLRQRISTFRIETAPVSDDVEVDDEPIPWTRVDWLILFLKCLIWACCQVLAIKFEFGAVFFSTSVFAVIYLYGFGKRDPEAMSAYSVFNENCQTLQGTLTAEQFDKEIRHQL